MFLWQTKEWGKMLLEGNQVEKIFYIGKIQIEKRSIGMGQYGLFILGVNLEQILNTKIFTKLEKIIKDSDCLLFQIETLDYNKGKNIIHKNLFKLKKGYYKKFINEYTAVIDLKKTEDEILKEMKPKGRYNIKIAQKKEIEIKEVEKKVSNIKLYYNLMLETTSRDNFNGHSIEYYTSFLTNINNSKLLLAYKNGEVIAGGIFVFNKEVSIYYYGASTSKKEYRNMMAPYLLQWKAIQIAQNTNSKIYDFLGVAPEGVKNHTLSGVTTFKGKLTKDFRKVSEGYIYIKKPFSYFILNIFRKMKKIYNILVEK